MFYKIYSLEELNHYKNKQWREKILKELKNDPCVVHRCHLMDVMGSCAGAFDGSLLIGVVQSLSRTESGSTVGKLYDHRRVDLSGRL